ncbi:MAG: hypothetical protein LBG47_10630 [Prevotellaceae bacterium]|jgi:hypothetical protein|nr:hypothetical protein [Prevotellaceae bacterium]
MKRAVDFIAGGAGTFGTGELLAPVADLSVQPEQWDSWERAAVSIVGGIVSTLVVRLLNALLKILKR